jgi:hypothetical protein
MKNMSISSDIWEVPMNLENEELIKLSKEKLIDIYRGIN